LSYCMLSRRRIRLSGNGIGYRCTITKCINTIMIRYF
jgi:hypothetical protein